MQATNLTMNQRLSRQREKEDQNKKEKELRITNKMIHHGPVPTTMTLHCRKRALHCAATTHSSIVPPNFLAFNYLHQTSAEAFPNSSSHSLLFCLSTFHCLIRWESNFQSKIWPQKAKGELLNKFDLHSFLAAGASRSNYTLPLSNTCWHS